MHARACSRLVHPLTLGGWIATRSSGMQSDRYGDIADLTKGLRVVTPTGILVVRPIPSMSAGPSIREMILGSEGRLGIITEATTGSPAARTADDPGFLSRVSPTVWWRCRRSPTATARCLHARPRRGRDAVLVCHAQASDTGGAGSVGSAHALPQASSRLGRQPLLSFIGYEGRRRHVAAQRHAVGQIVGTSTAALCIGSGPGALMTRRSSTRRTSVTICWTGAGPATLGDGDAVEPAVARLRRGHGRADGAFTSLGVQGYLMCHLSHSYHAGACLYFTFAFRSAAGEDMLVSTTSSSRPSSRRSSTTAPRLSHHHAVGTEHAPWLEQDISAPGTAMLRALFDGTDPDHRLNPGKIL